MQRRCGLYSADQIEREVCPTLRCEMAGDQSGLIEASAPDSPPMEWNWDEQRQLAGITFRMEQSRHMAGHHSRENEPSAIFKAMGDGSSHGTIRHDRTSAIIRRRVCEAGAALEAVRTHLQIDAAPRSDLLSYELDRNPTWRTDRASHVHDEPARRAAWRQRVIQQWCRGRFKNCGKGHYVACSV